MQIFLPVEILATVSQHAATTYPHECCGLLIGRAPAHIMYALPADNRAAPDERRSRYVIDPRTIFDADRRARIDGLDILGAYHSHPDHPAIPSATDAAQAWEHFLYLIIPVSAGSPGTPRAWRFTNNAPTECAISAP